MPETQLTAAFITPECRENRGDYGAWTEAMARLYGEYAAVLRGWRESPVQPTLNLRLTLGRPTAAPSHDDDVLVRVSPHLIEQLAQEGSGPVHVLGLERYDDGTFYLVLRDPDHVPSDGPETLPATSAGDVRPDPGPRR